MKKNIKSVNELLIALGSKDLYSDGCGGSLANYADEELTIDYIGGLFPRGSLSAVIADGGVGKSWCMLMAALSITDGRRIFPGENYRLDNECNVLIIETEGRMKRYVQRLKGLKATLSCYRTAYNNLDRICGYSNEDDRNQIVLAIESQEPELLIVDSFAAFSDVDENSAEVLPCLKWLTGLAVKYNMAVVFTQLVNKNELKEGRLSKKNMRGHSALYQMPELIWAIDQPVSNNETLKRMYQVKNNIEEIVKQDYLFELSNYTFRFDADLNPDKFALRKQILDANKDKSQAAIARLIQQTYEPTTPLRTLRTWVSRQIV